MGDSTAFTPRVRHDGWTGARRRGFLDALAQTGNVRDACRAVGLSNTSAYRLRRIDRAFGVEWDAALGRSAKSLEAVAYARAVEGVEEPIYQGGKLVGTRRKTSDALLRLLLQGADPAKYGRTGRQPSVQEREELEARIKDVEEAAYARAWAAFRAEYTYALEPVIMRIHVMRSIGALHRKICGNALCRACHPERFDRSNEDWDYLTDPGEDHQPIDPPSAWFRDECQKLEEEVAQANLEGRTLADPVKSELPSRAGKTFVQKSEEQWAANRAAAARGEPFWEWQRPGWVDPRKPVRR